MIKVAHVVTAYQSVVTIMDSKLRHLGNYPDLDVSVISSPPPSPDRRQPAVRYIPLDMARNISPLADIRSVWSMYRLFRREKYDIVHSHTAKAGFITAIAAKLAGVKQVYHTSHGLPFYDGQPDKQYKRYKSLEKFACRFRHHLFTQNKHDYKACLELMNGDESKVSVEGNGVDVDYVNQTSNERLDEAKTLFPNNGGVKIAMLCRYEPVKRITDFLEVVKKLKNKNIEISAVVTGKGPQEEKLKAMVDSMDLRGCVSITGYYEYPHSVLAVADMVMLCSEKEGIPRVLMEAMALKKPVVATDVLGTQELVDDHNSGYLAPLGDIETLAEKVELLITQPKHREEMGGNGYHRVLKNFNDVKIADYLHSFYVSRHDD